MGKKKNIKNSDEDIKEEKKCVSKQWDTLMKLVIKKGAQAFASLALPRIQIGEALDKELRVTNIEGDLFLDAWWDRLQIIVHFEFQRKEGRYNQEEGWQGENHGSADVGIQCCDGYLHGLACLFSASVFNARERSGAIALCARNPGNGPGAPFQLPGDQIMGDPIRSDQAERF